MDLPQVSRSQLRCYCLHSLCLDYTLPCTSQSYMKVEAWNEAIQPYMCMLVLCRYHPARATLWPSPYYLKFYFEVLHSAIKFAYTLIADLTFQTLPLVAYQYFSHVTEYLLITSGVLTVNPLKTVSICNLYHYNFKYHEVLSQSGPWNLSEISCVTQKLK